MNVVEQGMFGVGSEHLFISFPVALKESFIFHAVELDPDDVGGSTKFTLQVAQVGHCVAVKEELQ